MIMKMDYGSPKLIEKAPKCFRQTLVASTDIRYWGTLSTAVSIVKCYDALLIRNQNWLFTYHVNYTHASLSFPQACF